MTKKTNKGVRGAKKIHNESKLENDERRNTMRMRRKHKNKKNSRLMVVVWKQAGRQASREEAGQAGRQAGNQSSRQAGKHLGRQAGK